MAIRRMADNVAVISSLPDTPQPPAYNAAILKSKFDEAANKIKTYINALYRTTTSILGVSISDIANSVCP